jgi:hypothetical protein
MTKIFTTDEVVGLPFSLLKTAQTPEWYELMETVMAGVARDSDPKTRRKTIAHVTSAIIAAAPFMDVVRVDPKIIEHLWGQGDLSFPRAEETIGSSVMFVFDEGAPVYRYESPAHARGDLVDGIGIDDDDFPTEAVVRVALLTAVSHGPDGHDGDAQTGWMVQLFSSIEEALSQAKTDIPDDVRKAAEKIGPLIPWYLSVVELDGEANTLGFSNDDDQWDRWRRGMYRFLATLMWWVNDRLVCGAQVASRPRRREIERRHGMKPKPVRYVALRRSISDRREAAMGGRVDWSHRWPVSGHWRHYSNGRTIWIAPYTKGPADAPFIDKRNVYQAKR